MTETEQNFAEAQLRIAHLDGVTQQVLARKAILQSDILAFPESNTAFGQEVPLDIGIFRVFPTTAEMDWMSPSGKLALKKGQVYLDFHMPKSDNLSNRTANESYTLIASYLRTRPDITHIVGVTYRVMAMSGQRNQGFSMEELALPAEVMTYASAFWQNMMPDLKPKQFEQAYLMWQDRKTFIDHFDGDGL